MRVRGRTVAPVLRGWPPHGRECRASLLVAKLNLLHLGFWSGGCISYPLGSGSAVARLGSL